MLYTYCDVNCNTYNAIHGCALCLRLICGRRAICKRLYTYGDASCYTFNDMRSCVLCLCIRVIILLTITQSEVIVTHYVLSVCRPSERSICLFMYFYEVLYCLDSNSIPLKTSLCIAKIQHTSTPTHVPAQEFSAILPKTSRTSD